MALELTYTGSTPDYFRADMERVNTALERGGYVFTMDGAQWLEPHCPEQLARLHRDLLSMGLFNRWLTYESTEHAST